MDRWDLSVHQPQPPGYIAYILLARLVQRFGADHNLSLQLISMIATGLAVWLWWRLAQRCGVSRGVATVCAGLLATSPLVWLYSSVAEVYALDMLATLLVVSIVANDERELTASRVNTALAFAFAAAVRLPTAILMLPIVIVRRRDVVGHPIASASAVAAVTIGLMLLDPSFVRSLTGHFAFTTSATRLFGSSTTRWRS